MNPKTPFEFYVVNDADFGERFRDLPENAPVRFVDSDDNVRACTQHKGGRMVEDEFGTTQHLPEKWLGLDPGNPDPMNEAQFLFWLENLWPGEEEFSQISKLTAFGAPLSDDIEKCLGKLGFSVVRRDPDSFEAERRP